MSPAKPTYLLDSFALLAYLNDEAGKMRVQELLLLAKDSKCRLLMCQINLGEALYIVERERGLEACRDLVLDAAHIKANHALSYADAFAVAAAMREQAIVLTGDPEFESVDDLIEIEWLKEE